MADAVNPTNGAVESDKTADRSSTLLPLSGIKVIDLSRLLPGPYASMILADLGADVVKLEEPKVGDLARLMSPKIDDECAFFREVNRNKRSLTLNLKDPKGLEVFYRIIAQSDVLLEGFRPGVTERLGIDYKRVSEVNPAIVYCSITGYGQDSPLRDRSGHDVNYLGLAGLLGVTVDDKGKPVTPGTQIADLSGALMAVIGIQSALLLRSKTGKGQFIDLSMTDSVLALLPIVASGYFAGAKNNPEGKYELTGANPYYAIYRTKDGRYMSVGALETKFWENFCVAIGRPELKKRQFDEGKKREDLFNLLKRMFGSKTQSEWVEVFAGHDACCEPVLTFGEVVDHPNTKARKMIINDTSGQPHLASAIKFSNVGLSAPRPSPRLGEHTQEILKEFGFSQDEEKHLAKRGITQSQTGWTASLARFVSRLFGG
ncbi:MAG TPA: CaiB/BaiF CoA-transferase family protein [Blastocatellia bacterium]|nr:CaiB/BaiF CoA-transferase family protein [Blastocatellia bacterium]